MNQDFTCTVALSARIGNNLSLAAAGWAGGSYREKALTSGDLAGSLAMPAVLRICSRLTGTAFTLRAGCGLFKVNFSFRPECGLHEVQPHVIAKIGASLGTTLGSIGSGKSEKVFKNPAET